VIPLAHIFSNVNIFIQENNNFFKKTGFPKY